MRRGGIVVLMHHLYWTHWEMQSADAAELLQALAFEHLTDV